MVVVKASDFPEVGGGRGGRRRWGSLGVGLWWSLVVVGSGIAADEPNEDQSQLSCTLFKPIRTNVGTGSTTNTAVRFRHVKLRWYLKHTMISDPYPAYLYADPTSDRLDVFRIRDWFTSSDNGDPTVGNEVFIIKCGNVRIKNNHFGKFWRCNPNWIWADSDDTTTDDSNKDTLFSPVKVGDNVIALRSMVNGSFCMRISKESKENCLNARVDTLLRK
ncbi:hypothetical protein RHMOL_Rhmol05G0011700 [Rhododendron molle]|uniref:Uncharacterized protein n=1 Tax=Rhododendron molle TaxID=49168 RepID=A0ACC0NJF0_RHOML|nr:hypothetical protein RHMOL_Rhmol05G0011700 [Rhododendron molle]